MAFELFTDVILTADLPTEGLKTGDVGTVVERHQASGLEDAYSVEFMDMTGKTIAVVLISQGQLRSPTHSDLPSVRALAK